MKAGTPISWPGRVVRVAVWVGLCVVLVVCMPVSEWIAGGWDPGVYVNQGVHTARTVFAKHSAAAYAGLDHDVLTAFTRLQHGRYEAFPGIPLTADGAAFAPYFYPVTPLWMGALYRLGGIQLTLRTTAILGLVAVTLLYALLRHMGWSELTAVAGGALLLLNPIFLYHMRTPCSEMMELVLMIGAMLAVTRRQWWMLGGVVLVGCLNRPGFMLVGGIVTFLACLRVGTGVSREGAFRALGWTGIAIALALGFYRGPGAESVVKIRRAMMIIELGTGMCLLGALGVLLLRKAWLWRVAGVVPVVCLLAAVSANPRGLADAWAVTQRMMLYSGVPLLVLALAGIALAGMNALRGTRRGADAWMIVLTCASALAIPLGYKHVADLYPWATKRVLSSLPLLVALGGAMLVKCACQRGRVPALVCCGVLTFGVGMNGERVWHAFHRVEYKGLYGALQRVATQIEPGDVVVADHFTWATPLALVFDRVVLNGEPLWHAPSARRIEAAMGVLRQKHAAGQRVLLLSSSRRGVEIFPEPFRNARAIGPPVAYQCDVVAHHRRARGFAMREIRAVFQLAEWEPEGGASEE